MISSIIYFKISSRGIHRTTSNRLRGTTSCLKASMATAQPEPSATVSTQAIQGNSSLADSAMEFRIKNQLTIKGCDASLFPPMTEFKDTPFSRGLRNVFKEEKYDAPTPIQAQTWPIILGEKDVISIARTGSGKTCGFVLPGIQRILEKKEGVKMRRVSPSMLVVAPTRELSVQIEEEARKYAKAVGLSTVCLYGGVSKNPQMKELREGRDIIIGTPGRLNDLAEAGFLDLRHVHYLVLDEADRMLDMGFEPQIRALLNEIPTAPTRQTVFFTATWPKEVQLLALEFLTSPVLISAGDSGQLNANNAIKQHVYVMKPIDKTERLLTLIDELSAQEAPDGKEVSKSRSDSVLPNKPIPKIIIFMARKSECDDMAHTLRTEGYSADSLHGDMSQDKRDRTLSRFRNNKIRILIATDLAARGLDVKDIEVVVNYDFPKTCEDYVHRIGRTARADRSGASYSFLTNLDSKVAKPLIDVMQRAGQTVPRELIELATRSIGRDGSMRNSSSRGYSNDHSRSTFAEKYAGMSSKYGSSRYGDMVSRSNDSFSRAGRYGESRLGRSNGDESESRSSFFSRRDRGASDRSESPFRRRQPRFDDEE